MEVFSSEQWQLPSRDRLRANKPCPGKDIGNDDAPAFNRRRSAASASHRCAQRPADETRILHMCADKGFGRRVGMTGFFIRSRTLPCGTVVTEKPQRSRVA